MKRGEGGVGDFTQPSMFSCNTIEKMAKTLESKKGMLGLVERTRADIVKSLNEMVDSHNLDYNAVSHHEKQLAYRSMGHAIAECALLSDGAFFCSDYGGVPLPGGCMVGGPSPPNFSPPNLGLLLARVKMGDSVGRADHTDTIPYGSKRTKGIAVRVTEMFYSVARNAEFTKPRIYRFMQQMSFAKRAGNLIHGSVVTGEVNID